MWRGSVVCAKVKTVSHSSPSQMDLCPHLFISQILPDALSDSDTGGPSNSTQKKSNGCTNFIINQYVHVLNISYELLKSNLVF